MISKKTETDGVERNEITSPEGNPFEEIENEGSDVTETKKQDVAEKYSLLTAKTGNQDELEKNGAAKTERADQNVTEKYGVAVPCAITNGAVLAETKNSEAEVINGEVIEMERLIADKNEISTDDHGNCGDNKTRDTGIPVDRGWAWMILLGATIEMVIVVGMLKSAGILFVAFQERFRSSSSMTSLISTVQNGVWSIGALLVMTVGMKFFSARTIHMIGGTALCLAYVISSRAEDVKLLLLSHGVIQGIGMACMEPVSLIMLGTYFEKRRGLANSIANSGGSFGGLVFAPLLTAMFEYYGYSGAMLLCGAFFLQGFISGALFRSPKFYTRTLKPVKDRASKEQSEIEDLKNESTSVCEKFPSSKSKYFVRQHSQTNESSSAVIDRHKLRARVGSENQIEALLNSQEFVLSKQSKIKRVRTYTDTEVGKTMDPVTRLKTTKYTSAECIVGSQFDIPSVVKVENDSAVKSYNEKSNGRTCTSCLHGFAKLFDFSLFRNPVFVVYLIAAGILCTPHALCMVYIAPHAKDMGVDSAGLATLLTVYSAIDMCSRIIIGVVSDKKWIRRSTMIGITSCAVGLMSHLMIFYTSFNWFMFYCVVFGLIGGTYFTLFAVVILDYFSLEKLQSCLGFTFLLQALIVSSTFAVLGYLRDNTGSYIVPFHLLGALSLVGGSLMAVLPIVEKCHHEDKQPKEQ